MASFYKAACVAINRKEADATLTLWEKDVCCLCFEPVALDSERTQVEDTVVFESQSGCSPCHVLMSNVLLSICKDFSENMSVFKTVCNSCSKSAINFYKFMQKCKNSAEQFTKAVENLCDCFENVADNILDYEIMYASINIADLTIEQIYYDKRQSTETALVDHANGIQINKERKNRKTKTKQKSIVTDNRNPTTYEKRKTEERDTENNNTLSYEERQFKESIVNKNAFLYDDRKPKERDISTMSIKTHDLMLDPKSKEYTCKLCMKRYPKPGGLRKHYFSLHVKKNYQCTICQRSYGSSGLLHTHTIDTHSYKKCDICGKYIGNKSMRDHLLTHQPKSKLKMICKHCSRSYQRKSDYKKHLAQETCMAPSKLPGNYYCDDCGKHCRFRKDIIAHIKYEHSSAKGYICKWCGIKYYNPSTLKTHILKHAGKKKFQCNGCGGTFTSRNYLTTHMRIHTGELPYSCEHCDQQFSSKTRKKQHVERHHSISMFECDLCDNTYCTRRSLLKHTNKQHCDIEA